MSHTAIRTAIAVSFVLAGAILPGVPGTTVRADLPRIVVRLYDTASVGTADRAEAVRGATQIIGEAGIAVDWRDCSVDGSDHPCRTVRSARDLVVRIMPAYLAGAASPRTAVSARDGSGGTDLQLGFAAVEPETCTGVMATIYHDRVLKVARRAGAEYSHVLGRAIAHEIGHLLLCAPGHSPSGLMRAVWTDTELYLDRHDDWAFTLPERRQLRVGFLAATALDRAQARATFRTTLP